MVEQFGLAIILSEEFNCPALISGIINFLEGSILQAEELSITTVPASANLGAHSKDVDPPAENKAMSGRKETAVFSPTTWRELLPNTIFFPTDLSEATRINSVNGKFLSDRT